MRMGGYLLTTMTCVIPGTRSVNHSGCGADADGDNGKEDSIPRFGRENSETASVFFLQLEENLEPALV